LHYCAPPHRHPYPTRRSSDLDRDQINRTMPTDGLDRRLAALSLADHAEQTGFCQHGLSELVHARRRGRTGGTDRLVADRIDRARSEEHTSELQSPENIVCRLL